MFIVKRHSGFTNKMPRRQWGWGYVTDAALIGAVGAMFAVIAGLSLVIAAIAFFRRLVRGLPDEFTVGYDLTATQFVQNR